jgi:hypothetical protein
MSAAGKPQPRQRTDLWLALGLILAAAGLYLSTRQNWLFNDGFGLVARLSWDPGSRWPHPGYVPFVRSLHWLQPGAWPYGALLSASWLPAAVMGAGLYALARKRLPGWSALALSGALLCSPLVWFFATTVEVHALHGAAVTLGVVALHALPWRRPMLAIPLAAVAFVPAAATHLMSVLLIPGWLVLCRSLASNRRPLSWRHLGLVLLPALIGLEWCVLWNSDGAWWQSALSATGADPAAMSVPLRAVAGIWAQVQRDARPFSLDWLKEDLVAPLGLVWLPLLWLLVLLGASQAWRSTPEAPGVRAQLCLVVPLLLFTALWGVPNQGGYMFGVLPGLLMLAAEGYRRLAAWPRAAQLLAPALLLSVLWPAQSAVLAWRKLYQQEDRAERARATEVALGGRGVLVSLDPRRQPVGFDLPEVLEHSAAEQLLLGLQAGELPAVLAERIGNTMDVLLNAGQHAVAIEAPWLSKAAAPGLEDYALALHEALEQRFALELVPSSTWPVLRVRMESAGPAGNQAPGR